MDTDYSNCRVSMQETPSPSFENSEEDERKERSPRHLIRRQKGWYLGDGYEYDGRASPQGSEYDDVITSSSHSEREYDEVSSADSLTYRYGRTLGKISE